MRIELDRVMDIVYLVADGVTLDVMTLDEYTKAFGWRASSELLRA